MRYCIAVLIRDPVAGACPGPAWPTAGATQGRATSLDKLHLAALAKSQPNAEVTAKLTAFNMNGAGDVVEGYHTPSQVCRRK